MVVDAVSLLKLEGGRSLWCVATRDWGSIFNKKMLDM